jgi:hypothetical protein
MEELSMRRRIFPVLVNKVEHKLLSKLSRDEKVPMAELVRRWIRKAAKEPAR